jgi:hypothetical protein
VRVETLTKADKDLASLRRMLARRRAAAARVGLTAAGLMALLSRVPADHPVWVSARDLTALVSTGDEQQGGLDG